MFDSIDAVQYSQKNKVRSRFPHVNQCVRSIAIDPWDVDFDITAVASLDNFSNSFAFAVLI
jgi:hypothetical protein